MREKITNFLVLIFSSESSIKLTQLFVCLFFLLNTRTTFSSAASPLCIYLPGSDESWIFVAILTDSWLLDKKLIYILIEQLELLQT